MTGAQLGILRIVAEHGPGGTTPAWPRDRLVPHPATLGQLVDRLARRGLVELAPDPGDRRRRPEPGSPESELAGFPHPPDWTRR